MSELSVRRGKQDRPVKYERRKTEILAAAVEAVNRKGVRAMTLGDVAAHLGLGSTAVSYYYRKKEQLAAACFLQALERYEDLIAQAEPERDPRVRLRSFFHVFARYFAKVALGESPAIAMFNDVRAIRDSAVNSAFTHMFRRVRQLIANGPPNVGTPMERNARAHLVISQAFWAVLWLERYDPRDYERMIDRMVDILLDGFAPSGARWSQPVPPASKPASEEGGGVSRAAFLRVATEMINEEGYHGASVARICERLQVTKGAFYHHNDAKSELVAACFDRTLTTVRQTQVEAEQISSNGFDGLWWATATLVSRDISGEAPLLRTSALSTVPEDMRAQLIRRFDQTSARFASMVSDGVADGSVRAIDANVAAQMVTTTVNASAELKHWAPGVTPENSAEVYARPLFTGLFPSPAKQ